MRLPNTNAGMIQENGIMLEMIRYAFFPPSEDILSNGVFSKMLEWCWYDKNINITCDKIIPDTKTENKMIRNSISDVSKISGEAFCMSRNEKNRKHANDIFFTTSKHNSVE